MWARKHKWEKGISQISSKKSMGSGASIPVSVHFDDDEVMVGQETRYELLYHRAL